MFGSYKLEHSRYYLLATPGEVADITVVINSEPPRVFSFLVWSKTIKKYVAKAVHRPANTTSERRAARC